MAKLVYTLLCFVLLGFGNPSRAKAQEGDSLAVKQCVSKYIQSFYQSKPDFFAEAVHFDLAKRVVKDFHGKGDYLKVGTYEEMRLLTQVFNQSGRFSADSKAEIKILDLQGKTASVKLTTDTWYDYIHLAKMDGQWKIINILWGYLDLQNPRK